MRLLTTLAVSLACLAALAVFGHSAPVEAASSRVALLIANADYPDSDAELPTPKNDAAALAEALTRRGFAVEVVTNLTKDRFQSAIDGFMRRIEPGSTALIFYSGYAIQVARKNYLIPIDAKIWSEPNVLQESVGVDTLMAETAKRGASNRLLVLDASRRNPFERRYRSFSTGLAPAAAQPGSLVLYSAAAGSVVNETSAGRSLFATELVKQIALPGISAEEAFGATRDALSKASKGQQVPALVSTLEDPFSFDQNYVKPAALKQPSAAVEPEAPPLSTKPVTIESKAEPKSAEPVAKLDLPPDPGDPPLSPLAAAPSAAVEPKSKPLADANPTQPVQTAAKEPDAPLTSDATTLREFEDAKAIGSREAYQDFLNRHPDGSLATQARAEIAKLDTTTSPQSAQPPTYTPAESARKAALDERIKQNPRDEQAYYERGQFYAQRGETMPAIADFDQSIRMNPRNPEAYNNRCWMQAVAGALDRARADCDQALKLRPNYVDALDSRGFVNLKASRFREAVADYDAALRLDPVHSSSLYGRGIAKRRLGLTGPAEKDFAGALQLNAGIGDEFAGYGLR
ncbi:caspase family protein [Methylobacterium gnaphalii]|uniref:Caspase family p20 domain-containing protein n=1 Tax=Methylobacterium gnaphalii TaxID=1010610 RepID=A0A512JH07_9HYPH|nr:caspase family protein [Methylobacterium gnaphalii]GEP09234.1 hypothetical protein MGN01_10790 [Methylobacterium gnaphalii]GJD67646.1 hypothetical protein MMMDOFMJ_0562 [Methylobacterium gnaphalii]GLS49226.1 hypothetical protein GCM10007885_20740 [Methylobacterium gnaphalii]